MSSSDSGRSASRSDRGAGKRGKSERKDKKDKRDKKDAFSASQFDQIMGAIGGVKSEVTDVKVKVSGVSGQLNHLQGEFTTFKEETTNKFDDVRQTLEAHSKNIKELQDKAKTGGGSGAADPNPYTPGFVPVSKRTVIFVGGFPYNTEKDLILQKLKEMAAPYDDNILDYYTTRKLTSFGKIKFKTSDDMWDFINGTKAVVFKFEDKALYHSIDKTESEIKLSKKVSAAVKLLKTHFETNGIPKADLKKYVDAEWNYGTVMFKDAPTSKFVIAFTKPKGQDDLVVNSEARVPWGLDLNEHVEGINAAARKK